jgi:uncharacterized protein
LKVFLDTSAFAKRYVDESGTAAVQELCVHADALVVSVICLPELVSTLSRLVREKKLKRTTFTALKNLAIADLADVDICQITNEVLSSAIDLLEAHPLRAMDALHLACALTVHCDVFASADHRQLAAARKTGLQVLDVS